MSDLLCTKCNKEFSSKGNLTKHIKVVHKVQNNDNKVVSNKIQIENKVQDDDDKLICNFCHKKSSRLDNLKKHLLICKMKNKIEIDLKSYNAELLLEINQLKETIKQNNLKNNELEERIKQQDLIISELLIKCKSKTINNNNINNGNINNGNINNNINIISFGNEDIKNILSNKEKHDIICSKHMCLEKLINHIHFNDNYKQYNNILITNLKDNLAYIYDAINRQFMAVNKDDFMEDLLNLRMADITSIYNELVDKNEVDIKTRKIIELLQDKIENNQEYKDSKKNTLKLFVYNKSKTISK